MIKHLGVALKVKRVHVVVREGVDQIGKYPILFCTWKNFREIVGELECVQVAEDDDASCFTGLILVASSGIQERIDHFVQGSQLCLAFSFAGLEEKLFQPEGEIRKDFYAEKPIKIRLDGGYHEFGTFVSDIAALPRIVTLHDITIKPATKNVYDDLVLNVTAKTYRYLEDEEILEMEAEAKKNKKRKKKRRG